jgi:translocation and assembly module TamB
VVQTNELFDLQIKRLESFAPDLWYRKAKREGTNAITDYLQVNGWKLRVHSRAKSGTHAIRTDLSTYAEFKQAEKYIALIRQWLPKATLINGTIVYQDREYTFPVITWEKGKLDASGVWPVSAVPLEIKARLTGDPPYQVYYAMTPLDLRARVQLWETNNLLNVRLTGGYKETTINGNAEFEHEGLLPVRAKLSAPEFHLSPALLKLPGYQEITGNLTANWKTNSYALNLKAHAEAMASSSNFPPADIELIASGNTNQVRIEHALSTAPGLKVTISEPLSLTYKGEMLSERSEVNLNIELEKLRWVKMSGRAEAKIVLEKGGKFPRAKVQASGTNLSGYNLSAERFGASGTVSWPELDRIDARLQFKNNSFVEISSSANLQTREIGKTEVRAEGQIATNLLPSGFNYSYLKLSALLSGAVTNLEHKVELQLRELSTPQTTPLNLEALWSGKMAVLDHFMFRAHAGPAVLTAGGSSGLENGKTNIVVSELKLSKGDELYLGLEKPSLISLSNPGGGSVPRIELQPLSWKGEAKALKIAGELEWPKKGNLQFAATNINPELFQFFVKRSLNGIQLPRVSANAFWNEGPLLGKFNGNFSIEQQLFKRLSSDLKLELNEGGLTISKLRVDDATGEMAHAKGFLPVSIHPLDPAKVHLSTNQNIEFELETAPNSAFWNALTKITQLKLTNAAVALDLRGTVMRPMGTLRFSAASLEYLKAKRELPFIGPVEGTVVLNEDVLKIPRVRIRVEDQSLNLDGTLRLGTNFWTLRREQVMRYAMDNAELHLEAPEVHVAPFVKFLPKYFTPAGNIKINAGIKPGRHLAGNISFAGIETRPLPKIGVIQEIGGNVQLNDKRVDVSKMQAVLGGETLFISGNVDLSQTNMDTGYPSVDLRISGQDLPLARNPDVILRSDLDLTVRNGTNHIPVIAGNVNLRDSFLLRDIQTLVPGRVTKPSRRPPYFSIEQEPLRDWGLDMRVRGDNFLRVRSPFFQGEVSAAMQINGTLMEPVALGEASITSGKIIFPFAPLEVKQAIVSLSADDPYRPTVFAIATGRAFGFDIRMQAEGPADRLAIQFSSVPSLTSEQIILMLTTGQIPRSDFGFSNQEKASKLAFFVGKSVLAKLSPGKAGEEKFVIRSGENITEQGRQTYSLEYKINDTWSLIGEYDRFGALNADVKWKLFSK